MVVAFLGLNPNAPYTNQKQTKRNQNKSKHKPNSTTIKPNAILTPKHQPITTTTFGGGSLFSAAYTNKQTPSKTYYQTLLIPPNHKQTSTHYQIIKTHHHQPWWWWCRGCRTKPNPKQQHSTRVLSKNQHKTFKNKNPNRFYKNIEIRVLTKIVFIKEIRLGEGLETRGYQGTQK